MAMSDSWRIDSVINSLLMEHERQYGRMLLVLCLFNSFAGDLCFEPGNLINPAFSG